MERFAKFLQEGKFNRILDVGTGSGNFVGLLNNLYTDYEEIIGIDTHERSLEMAKKNFQDGRIVFENMDALEMSYEDDSFDLVCLSNSLHHLSDPSAIFKEMERVLKPGGKLIVSEMVSDNLDKRQMSHLIIHHFAAKIDRLRGDTHNETMSHEEIIESLNINSQLPITKHWDLTYERRGENTEEEIKWFIDTVDRLVSRVPEELKDEYMKEADSVKDYIKKHGFDSATTLLCVLSK